MLDKINPSKYSILVKNITALTFLQFMNYLFSFITIPYVVRVLGVEKFGLVSFAAAFTAHFTLLVDFGFNYSATRSISINSDNPLKASRIITSVYLIKFVMFFLSLLLFILIVSQINIFSRERELYFYSFISIIGTLLLPVWYFQGTENVIVLTKITFYVKLILVTLIFILIKSGNDYKFYTLLNSLSNVLIGIVSFTLIRKKILLSKKIKDDSVRSELKEGGIMFVSNMSINLYTVSNTFILGLFAPPVIVGYWSAADKIRMAIQNILMPVTQAIYPRLSKLFISSPKLAMQFIERAFPLIILFSFIISAILYVFAEEIVKLILGLDYLGSVYILKIISFLPLVITLSNLSGTQVLLNLKGSKEFTLVVLSSAIINIIASFIIVPKLLAVGTSISVVLTELLVTFLMLYFAFKKIKAIGEKIEV